MELTDELICDAIHGTWQCAIKATEESTRTPKRWWESVMSELDGMHNLAIRAKCSEEVTYDIYFLWCIAHQRMSAS